MLLDAEKLGRRGLRSGYDGWWPIMMRGKGDADARICSINCDWTSIGLCGRKRLRGAEDFGSQ